MIASRKRQVRASLPYSPHSMRRRFVELVAVVVVAI